MGYVDAYCERLAPELWAEPLNAVSNLTFLIAAVAVWRAAGQATTRALAVLIGVVFLGSSAFHITATQWGAAVDSGAILVFLLYYILLFTHSFAGLAWPLVWLAAPAFVAFTALVALAADAAGFGGPGMYLSALLTLVGERELAAAARAATVRGGERGVRGVADVPHTGRSRCVGHCRSARTTFAPIQYNSRAKDEMFVHTDIPEAPWYVVESEDKRRARINMIAHLLSTIPYREVQRPALDLPPRPPSTGYRRPPREMQAAVPDHAATLTPHQ